MKTNVRDTSLEAYAELDPSTQQYEIAKFLKGRPQGATRHEIHEGTGIAINAVCGRINELIERNICEETGERRSRQGGRSGYVVYLSPRRYMHG